MKQLYIVNFYVSTRVFGVEPKAEPLDIGFGLFAFSIMFGIILFVWMAYNIWSVYIKWVRISREWRLVELLFEKHDLTREESIFIRNRLRESRSTMPGKILRVQSEYEKLMRETRIEKNDYQNALVRSVHKKLFSVHAKTKN